MDIYPVRAASAVDAPALHQLFSASFEEHARASVSVAKFVRRALTTDFSGDFVGRANGPQFFVAPAPPSASQGVLGCIALDLREGGTRAELKHVCVDAAARCRGIGAQLVQHALAIVAAQPRRVRVTLDTLATMDAAARLYRRAGFVETHSRDLGSGAAAFRLISFALDMNVSFPAEVSPPPPPPRAAAAAATATAAALDEQLWRTGETVRFLRDGVPIFAATVERQKSKGGSVVVRLGLPSRPYARLTVHSKSGDAAWLEGQAGKFSQFIVVAEECGENGEESGCGRVRLQLMANRKKGADGGGWHLGARGANTLMGNAVASSSAALFDVEAAGAAAPSRVNARADARVGGLAIAAASLAATTAAAGADVKAQLRRDGFAVVRGAVPLELVDAALAEINRSLGTPGMLVPGGVEPGQGKLSGGVQCSLPLLNLLRGRGSSALELATNVVGRGKLHSPKGCQLALRFPQRPPEGCAPGEWRLPGTEWHTDGMRQGLFHPFSLLLGVALSAVRAPFRGNFAVFPGSHEKIHPLLQADGRLDGCEWSNAKRAADPWCAELQRAAGDGAGQTERNASPLRGLPDMGDATQLLFEPGDVVLAHPNLAHRGAPNWVGGAIRYMVYFRLRHVALLDAHPERNAMARRLVSNMWADLEGMAAPGAAPALPPLPPIARATPLRILSVEQVDAFRRNGYVVVPGIVSPSQLDAAHAGLVRTLARHGVEGVDAAALAASAPELRALSSTGGAGGTSRCVPAPAQRAPPRRACTTRAARLNTERVSK